MKARNPRKVMIIFLLRKIFITFLLHLRKLITQIVSCHPVATARFLNILCCSPWLIMKIKIIEVNKNIINKKTKKKKRIIIKLLTFYYTQKMATNIGI